ncbi:MAG: hypothetical protein ABW277_28350 [Longimicrobiaceae bacterium]
MRREPLDPEVPVDPEALAALLDGTLPEHERDEVLERLARSPAEYEAFVEAASVLRDLDDESGAPPVPPASPVAPPDSPPVREIRPARRGLPGAKLWLPLAAVLAGVMVVPGLVTVVRGPGGGAASAPLALLDGAPVVPASGDGSLALVLGQDWDQPGWPVKRGSGDSLTDESGEFRTGVRLADLDAAADARDTPAVQATATELTRMVERVGPDAGSMAEDFEALGMLAANPQSGRDPSAVARAVGEVGEAFRDSPWFGLGIWAGQARLAVLAGRVEFFESQEARKVLAGLADSIEREDTGASVAPHLRALDARIGGRVTPGEMDAIRTSLAAIIRESGG